MNPDNWNYTLLNYYGFEAIFQEVGLLTNNLDGSWWITEFGNLEDNQTLEAIRTAAVTATVWEDYFDEILLVRYPGIGYGDFLHWRISSVMWCDIAAALESQGITQVDWMAKFSRLQPVPIAEIIAYFSSSAGGSKWNSTLSQYFRRRFRQQKLLADAVVQSFPAEDPNSWSYTELNFSEFDAINNGAQIAFDSGWWEARFGASSGGGAVSVRIALIKLVGAIGWNSQLQQNMFQAYPN